MHDLPYFSSRRPGDTAIAGLQDLEHGSWCCGLRPAVLCSECSKPQQHLRRRARGARLQHSRGPRCVFGAFGRNPGTTSRPLVVNLHPPLIRRVVSRQASMSWLLRGIFGSGQRMSPCYPSPCALHARIHAHTRQKRFNTSGAEMLAYARALAHPVRCSHSSGHSAFGSLYFFQANALRQMAPALNLANFRKLLRKCG